jgi:DNA-binding transcriptional ArsR family regulator
MSTQPKTQPELILEILRHYNRPMSRKEILDAMVGRGQLADYPISQGKNAVSQLLSRLKAADKVTTDGTDPEGGGMLWTLPELVDGAKIPAAELTPETASSELGMPLVLHLGETYIDGVNRYEPHAVDSHAPPIQASQLTADTNSEIPGTIEHITISSLTSQLLMLPDLPDADEGIRTVIEFETPDGCRYPDLAQARAALQLNRQIDEYLASRESTQPGLLRSTILHWEDWKAERKRVAA